MSENAEEDKLGKGNKEYNKNCVSNFFAFLESEIKCCIHDEDDNRIPALVIDDDKVEHSKNPFYRIHLPVSCNKTKDCIEYVHYINCNYNWEHSFLEEGIKITRLRFPAFQKADAAVKKENADKDESDRFKELDVCTVLECRVLRNMMKENTDTG